MIDRTEIALWLRAAAEDPRCHGLNFDIRPLLKDGADEIERLRIQVAHYETQLKNADVVIDELEAERDEWMRLAYKSIGLEL